MNNTKQRNINIDLIKCIAVLSVICVNFFAYIKFYNSPINNTTMYIATTMRTLFMICVPLFLTTTGFLMINKELSPKYYKGIVRTLSIYLLASVLVLCFRYFYLHRAITFKSSIFSILDYTAAEYSWYIELYIGLFLMIPFLNLAYNGLKSDKQRIALIITMAALTTLPSLFNIKHAILPDFWVRLYPITYYFIGAHIRKTNTENSPKWRYLLLFIAIIIINSLMNIHFANGNKFVSNALNDWGGIQNVLSTTFLFLFISRLKLDKLPKAISFVIQKISELSLGIYLVSFIGDSLYYDKLNAEVAAVPDRLKYFVLLTGCVFMTSLLISIIINLIYSIINKLCHIKSRSNGK